MSTQQTHYDSASLSEAAYVEFDKLIKADWKNETKLYEFLKIHDSSNFSDKQAKEFAETWEVITHQSNTNSGFSATLFRRRNPQPGEQEYYYACRGTEGPDWDDLLATDIGNIVYDGLAFEQIVDLYNENLSTV